MNQSARLKRWIEIARWAASGGNAQPWHVEIDTVESAIGRETLRLILSIDPAYRARPSPMDVKGIASVMALGCFYRCLEIAALNDGYQLSDTEITGGDEFWEVRIVIDCSVSPGSRNESSLPEFRNEDVISRLTDRGPLSCDLIDDEDIDAIQSRVEMYPNIRFATFREFSTPSKFDLLPVLQELEKVRWRNPVFLSALLDEVHADDSASRTGIPLRQLGISRLDQRLLEMLQKSIFLKKIFGSISRAGGDQIAVRKATRDFLTECDLLVILSLDEQAWPGNPSSIFHFGRCFQDVWLEANRRGLSFQPIALPLIAFSYWSRAADFSRADARRIETATKEWNERLKLDIQKPMIGFRLGKMKKRAGRSPRRSAFEILGF